MRGSNGASERMFVLDVQNGLTYLSEGVERAATPWRGLEEAMVSEINNRAFGLLIRCRSGPCEVQVACSTPFVLGLHTYSYAVVAYTVFQASGPSSHAQASYRGMW